jgi:hypothetical protein
MRRFICCTLILGFLGPAGEAAEGVSAAVRLKAATAALQTPALAEHDSQRIKQELAALIAAEPGSETGLAARYLLGRLRQLEDGISEPPEFIALTNDRPQHPLAQLAAVKLLLRRLYADGIAAPAERLRAAEVLGKSLTLPALRGDFHLAMGDAYIFYGDKRAPALRHLRAAEDIGIPSAATRANVLVQIGELARLTGDRETAVQSYRVFLADFPRDLRQQIVQDRLAEMGAAAQP